MALRKNPQLRESSFIKKKELVGVIIGKKCERVDNSSTGYY